MSMHRLPSTTSARPARRAGVIAGLARAAGLAVPLLLVACATHAPSSPPPPALFDDAGFGLATQPIDPADVFKLTPAMRAYIESDILPVARKKGERAALTDALYNRSKLQLEYEASLTRNAAQAFEARQGNCLSLVIMTGAFAKEMGLKVTFQEVGIDDMWSRTGGLYFMSGHVNLQLEHPFGGLFGGYDRNGIYTIDFMPSPGQDVRAHPISEQTVLAMYMNNRAAEAMVQGRLDDAYWRARAAVRLDPTFPSAFNTLGVVYLRHGDAARAEAVLRYALAASPDNPRMLSNYAQTLRELGRTAEADGMLARLKTIEPYPPFYFFNRGQVALKAGDYAAAREYFRKELDRSPDYHEFHYALAIADFGLGRIDEARSELAIAMEDATRRTDHDLYAAKLDKLRAWQQTVAPSPRNLQ